VLSCLRPWLRSAARRTGGALLGATAWLLATALPLATATSQAQAQAPAPAPALETVRYGGDQAFAPIEWLDAKGKPQGLQIDLLNEITRETGLHFEVRLGPWKEIEAAFRAGQIDVVSMSVVESRRSWAAFSPPHAVPALAVYYRRVDAAPQSLADVVRGVIALRRSAPMLETRDEFFSGPGVRVLLTDTAIEALAAVRDGRADTAVMPRTYGDTALAAEPMPALTVSPFDLRLQSYAFATAAQTRRCASASTWGWRGSKPRAGCRHCA